MAAGFKWTAWVLLEILFVSQLCDVILHAGMRPGSPVSPVWHVAWHGAAATSGHNIMEVPAQLAALLGISDGMVWNITHAMQNHRHVHQQRFRQL